MDSSEEKFKSPEEALLNAETNESVQSIPVIADSLEAEHLGVSGKGKAFSPGVVMLFVKYPMDALVTEAVLAEEFGVSTRTIRRWVADYTLPPREPGLKMWRVGSIKSWFDKRCALASCGP